MRGVYKSLAISGQMTINKLMAINKPNSNKRKTPTRMIMLSGLESFYGSLGEWLKRIFVTA